MTSFTPRSEGPFFMQLGGNHRNMTTEPFEEHGPEYQFYGEFKRQVEHLINTRTESNLFRPAPHNKLIGESTAEMALIRRAERIGNDGLHDPETAIPSPEDTKNYQNMMRDMAKQALADANACDLYLSLLGKHRKAQMQRTIDDQTLTARQRLTAVKQYHWDEVTDHISVIISNYKQQWYSAHTLSTDLRSASKNLNLLQEINRQVHNFDHTETYTGLDMIKLLLPTIVATEFNQLVREWKTNIRDKTDVTITKITASIQQCFSIQDAVTDPQTYAFITQPTKTHQARVNNAYTYDNNRDRSQSRQTRPTKGYTSAEIEEIKQKSFRDGQRSAKSTSSQPRTETSYSQRQRSRSNNNERERSRHNERQNNSKDTRQQHKTDDKNVRTYTDRDRSRSRDRSNPRSPREQTPINQRTMKPKNNA